ncbi:MAG: hypothetical protein IJ789_05795 [Bacteroidales bacterium]|nr:hypothetical protein [Bacteroidales bacterium]
MANKFRTKEAEAEVLNDNAADNPQPENQPAEESTVGRRWRRVITSVLGGDVLKSRFVIAQIPLMLLIGLYLIIIVGNRYVVESLSQEKIKLESNLDYLREHRTLLQRQYQESVKISNIAQQLEGRGVGFTACPPYEVE